MRIVPFAALTLAELYAVLELRVAVFVVEQRCPYAEVDGLDPLADHLLATDGTGLAGTLRTFAPDAGGVARIGRIAVAERARGTGLGRRMMAVALAHLGPVPVAVSAQSHLAPFYASLGFVRTSDDHPIDDIPHCDMLRA